MQSPRLRRPRDSLTGPPNSIL